MKRENIAITKGTTIVGCKEGECPMAKPANHDPSVSTAEVVVPVPGPVPVPVIIPGPPSDADPYVMPPPDPVDVEPVGSDPEKSGGVVVTGAVTGVVVSLDDF